METKTPTDEQLVKLLNDVLKFIINPKCFSGPESNELAIEVAATCLELERR